MVLTLEPITVLTSSCSYTRSHHVGLHCFFILFFSSFWSWVWLARFHTAACPTIFLSIFCIFLFVFHPAFTNTSPQKPGGLRDYGSHAAGPADVSYTRTSRKGFVKRWGYPCCHWNLCCHIGACASRALIQSRETAD